MKDSYRAALRRRKARRFSALRFAGFTFLEVEMSGYGSGLTTVVLAGALMALTMEQARASLVITPLDTPLPSYKTISDPLGESAVSFFGDYLILFGGTTPVVLTDILELDNGAGVVGTNGPSLLAAGTTIGPTSPLVTASGFNFYQDATGIDGFFGVKSGNGYYGYIEDDNNVLVDAVFQSAPGVAITTASYVASPVPEPSSLTLLCFGVAGLAAAFRRRRAGSKAGVES